MSRPDALGRPAVGLDDVLCTEGLRRRPSRPPDFAAENRALTALAEAPADAPETILQKLVDSAVELCRADSSGISILEPGDEAEIFRWHAVAGPFGVNAGGTMARDASPCGTVMDRDAVLLFARPERHFTYPVVVAPPIVRPERVRHRMSSRPIHLALHPSLGGVDESPPRNSPESLPDPPMLSILSGRPNSDRADEEAIAVRSFSRCHRVPAIAPAK